MTDHKLIASIGGLAKAAKWDGRVATAAARQASQVTRYEEAVDPDRVLSAAERNRRVEAARKAYMRKLALKSAAARRSRKAAQ